MITSGIFQLNDVNTILNNFIHNITVYRLNLYFMHDCSQQNLFVFVLATAFLSSYTHGRQARPIKKFFQNFLYQLNEQINRIKKE
jgi:hypothetical protein